MSKNTQTDFVSLLIIIKVALASLAQNVPQIINYTLSLLSYDEEKFHPEAQEQRKLNKQNTQNYHKYVFHTTKILRALTRIFKSQQRNPIPEEHRRDILNWIIQYNTIYLTLIKDTTHYISPINAVRLYFKPNHLALNIPYICETREYLARNASEQIPLILKLEEGARCKAHLIKRLYIDDAVHLDHFPVGPHCKAHLTRRASTEQNRGMQI
jgi:hypothetical protein